MVELTDIRRDHGRLGSARWLGLLVGLAVAVIGYGFVGQVTGPPRTGPDRAHNDTDRAVAAAATEPTSTVGSDGPISAVDDQPMLLTAPIEGATVTSGIAVTGGVVVVDAIARRGLGVVHASVSIGGAVLGCRDVSVDAAGPIEVRIPVFPPAFDAPVMLRLASKGIGDRSGFAIARDLRLDIPSVVGFWDAAPTATVVQTGRVEMLIRGYGPRSARTVDIAIRDAGGTELAIDSVPIADDKGCPGSMGGGIFGLGSFVARLGLPAGTTGPWTLGARWRDAGTGLELHFETSLAPIPWPGERVRGGR
jgi:hypothetical protein